MKIFVVKISRIEQNLRKHQNFHPSKLIRYTVHHSNNLTLHRDKIFEISRNLQKLEPSKISDYICTVTYATYRMCGIIGKSNTVGRIIFKDIKFRGYSKFHFK